MFRCVILQPSAFKLFLIFWPLPIEDDVVFFFFSCCLLAGALVWGEPNQGGMDQIGRRGPGIQCGHRGSRQSRASNYCPFLPCFPCGRIEEATIWGVFFFFFFPALFFLLASPLGFRNLGSLKNKKLRRLTASIAALLLQHCLPISAARSWAYPCTRAKTYKAPVLPALSRLLEKFHRLANFHPLVSPLPSSLYLLCKRPLHCAWPCWASRAATTFPGLSSLFPEPRPASPFS